MRLQMQENPRRRSRRSPPKQGATLPFVPVIIGVVVLGFVIGAGLSVVGKRGSESGLVALSTSTPQAAPTLAPFTQAPAPSAVPSEAPSATPHPRTVTARPSAAASAPAAVPSAAGASQAPAPSRQTPAAGPSASAAVAIATAATRTAAPASAPVTPAASAPAAEPTAAPIAAPAAPPTAVSTAKVPIVDADSDFARLAGNVVRQYLLSIARGDTTSAYAVLSPGPGSGGAAPPEVGTVDSTLHIARIEARGSDSAATVNVDLTTQGVPYSGQYTVHRSPTGAALIVSHTFGKP
jgi:hypothetical protein